MTPLQAEQADNQRLAKAREAIAYYREKEAEAIRLLADARQQLAAAKEKYEALFSECEASAVKRRKDGLIINTLD